MQQQRSSLTLPDCRNPRPAIVVVTREPRGSSAQHRSAHLGTRYALRKDLNDTEPRANSEPLRCLRFGMNPYLRIRRFGRAELPPELKIVTLGFT